MTTKPGNSSEDNTIRTMQHVETAAIPASLLVGGYAAKVMTRRGSYRNVADTKTKDNKGLLDDLQEKHKLEKRRILAEAEKETTVAGKVGHLREYMAENKRYRKALKEKFRGMGFHNIFHHWEGLHPNQKVDVFITGATVSGILLGAVVLFSQNRSMAAAIKKQDRQREEDKHQAR